MNDLAFAPNGRVLATASDNQDTILWQPPRPVEFSDGEVREAYTRVGEPLGDVVSGEYAADLGY